jgi:hypothetical protein
MGCVPGLSFGKTGRKDKTFSRRTGNYLRRFGPPEQRYRQWTAHLPEPHSAPAGTVLRRDAVKIRASERHPTVDHVPWRLYIDCQPQLRDNNKNYDPAADRLTDRNEQT